MNQAEAKKFLPMVKALAEGEIIQVRANENGTWVDCTGNDPTFVFELEYRIKPKPNYRTFKDTNGVWHIEDYFGNPVCSTFASYNAELILELLMEHTIPTKEVK